ncbi:MAG: hypothetical protein D6701_07160 [Gemmatimonadetes bacterium]|nr:MAG: hypothetical protein D6701_07160 [Gemmatimonadota bacterium]
MGLTALLLGAAAPAGAQRHLDLGGAPPPAVPPDTLRFSGRDGALDVHPPRIDEPKVRIDGRLDEAVWAQAAVLTGFTQYEPVEGRPATEDTEVRVFYSRDAIYFGILAYDRDPSGILARLGERDRAVFGDDWVRLMLDTFDDQRQAYVFYVNPLGLQTDGLWIEGIRTRPGSSVSIDFNPDFIWESDGRVTDRGWVAEVRIPYVSLRFREVPVQDWGVQVAREVKRRGFKQSWAPLTRNEASTLAQSGHLRGLRDIHPRRLIEVNPVVTGSRTGALEEGHFRRGGFDPEVGINGRVGVTRNLVFDATVNPDFSQVEADANRLTVNERFALFFPEKRAFFLEGTEVFRTPRNLVHTRQIADPVAGAKLTGKVGAFQVGYLGAVDQAPRTLFGGDRDALFNLLRIRRDVGSGSTVGLLYTDRTLASDAYNRVLAADARLLVHGRYTLTGQFGASWTAHEGGAATGFSPLLFAQLERSGRTFGFELKLDDVFPDFRTESGFIPRTGDTEVFASARHTTFGRPGALLERATAEVRFDGFWEHDAFWSGASPFEWEVEAQPTLNLRGDRSLSLILRSGYFRFSESAFGAYAVATPGGGSEPFALPPPLEHMLAVGFVPRLRISNQVQLNGRIFLREIPIFVEGSRGIELQAAPDLTLRPTTALQVQLQHTFSRIRRQRDDSVFSTSNLSRLRVQYQFGKALFARAIVQFDLEERDALEDPATGRALLIFGSPVAARRSGRFDGQFLVQYEPSPGTIFFLGYSRAEVGEHLGFDLGRLDPVEDGLFLKLSYLFRL